MDGRTGGGKRVYGTFREWGDQKREVGRGGWENKGREGGFFDFRVVGGQKNGSHLKCK